MATPVPSNPGWYEGYIPSAVEWATEWSNKVDYPAPINQGGTGSQTVAGANSNLQQRSLVPGGVVTNINTLQWYGPHTASAPVELNLPPLASVTSGDWIELLDVDYNAAINNIQIFCDGSDELVLWGVSGTTALINISGTRALIVANTSNWSVSVW